MRRGGASRVASLAVALGRYFFLHLNERFSPQLPLLFGIGVLLYLLSVALHYVLLSMESSKEAETREQEALTLARESELKALKAALRGPRVTGPMAPDLPVVYSEDARYSQVSIPVSQIKLAAPRV